MGSVVTLDVGSRVLEHVLDDLIENQRNMAVVIDLHGVTNVHPGWTSS